MEHKQTINSLVGWHEFQWTSVFWSSLCKQNGLTSTVCLLCFSQTNLKETSNISLNPYTRWGLFIMYVASLQLGVGMAAQWSLANNATSGVALSLEGLCTPQGPHQTAARLLCCCLKSFINYRNEMQLCRVSDQSICSQESLHMHAVLFNSMQKNPKIFWESRLNLNGCRGASSEGWRTRVRKEWRLPTNS